MDELKKYMIEGQIQDELISEMNESNVPQKTDEEYLYMEYKAKNLVENILKEFEMAANSVAPTQAEDPYKNVDPKIKRSQALVRLLQDNLWKMCDMNRKPYHPEEELDDDIKALMTSNIEPLIKATVNKLHSVWFGENNTNVKPEHPNPADDPALKKDDEVNKEITVGLEVKTPQNESLKVKEIMGDKVMLEDVSGSAKLVDKTILDKWINKG